MAYFPSISLVSVLQALVLVGSCQSSTSSTSDSVGSNIARIFDVERGFVVQAPPEVELAGEVFDAQDDLPTRISKWQASTGKTSFTKKIVIDKKNRYLTVYADEDAIIRHPIELGFSPEGDKEKEGDGKTPEGTFYVCTKNKESRFHRFLGLSYPRPQDAERGYKAGMISTKERDAIKSAHQKKGLPPWKTALGGAVGIHGGGRFAESGGNILGFDWTQGCIAITNEQIEALFDFAEIGTEVEILP